ncbi:hypothetical protein ZOSMA_89G00810 [Zostera marina]|uniref:Uncharacterized protein n=1 Tax=Zostera marina TaxID=29655 RepID=A0A0K9NKJ9_ZOSMR|nr:hypothetical protein ZOSMA_89G00810 [Zostera marina]
MEKPTGTGDSGSRIKKYHDGASSSGFRSEITTEKSIGDDSDSSSNPIVNIAGEFVPRTNDSPDVDGASSLLHGGLDRQRTKRLTGPRGPPHNSGDTSSSIDDGCPVYIHDCKKHDVYSSVVHEGGIRSDVLFVGSKFDADSSSSDKKADVSESADGRNGIIIGGFVPPDATNKPYSSNFHYERGSRVGDSAVPAQNSSQIERSFTRMKDSVFRMILKHCKIITEPILANTGESFVLNSISRYKDEGIPAHIESSTDRDAAGGDRADDTTEKQYGRIRKAISSYSETAGGVVRSFYRRPFMRVLNWVVTAILGAICFADIFATIVLFWYMNRPYPTMVCGFIGVVDTLLLFYCKVHYFTLDRDETAVRRWNWANKLNCKINRILGKKIKADV